MITASSPSCIWQIWFVKEAANDNSYELDDITEQDIGEVLQELLDKGQINEKDLALYGAERLTQNTLKACHGGRSGEMEPPLCKGSLQVDRTLHDRDVSAEEELDEIRSGDYIKWDDLER